MIMIITLTNITPRPQHHSCYHYLNCWHEQSSAEVSEYAYERTLMMEQKVELMKSLHLARKQSLLLEQEVDGRLIKLRIRKSSMGDLEAADGGSSSPGQPRTVLAEHYPLVEMQSSLDRHQPLHQAGSGSQTAAGQPTDEPNRASGGSGPSARPDEMNVRRMHSALTLNEAILKRSKSAKLVIINLPPGASKVSTPEEQNFCKYKPFESGSPSSEPPAQISSSILAPEPARASLGC